MMKELIVAPFVMVLAFFGFPITIIVLWEMNRELEEIEKMERESY